MATVNSLLKEFRKKRDELHKLQAAIDSAEAKQFTDLPKQVGLKSVDELIKALARYASPRMKATLKVSKGAKPIKSAATKSTAKTKKRKRATITDEIRAKVVAAVKAGKQTAAEIAKSLGISVPSVANIKKAAGLTRKKEKK